MLSHTPVGAGWWCWPRAKDTGLSHVCAPIRERLRACEGLEGARQRGPGLVLGWTRGATIPLCTQIKQFSRDPPVLCGLLPTAAAVA